jgi:hypothetical protein
LYFYEIFDVRYVGFNVADQSLYVNALFLAFCALFPPPVNLESSQQTSRQQENLHKNDEPVVLAEFV